jgi:hypothetical protein
MLYSCDTYQYKDYSKVDCNMFEEEKKAAQREKQFPIDLENAYQLGKWIMQKAMKNHGKKGE